MTPHASLQSVERPAAVRARLLDAPPPAPEPGPHANPPGVPLESDWPTLAVLSRRYIDRALEHTGGNKTRASALLGIDRRTLNRILARERARKAAAG